MVIKDTTDLAERVKGRRKQLRLTQQDLAELTGISLRAINQLESGESSMGFTKLMAVLSILGLTLKLEVVPIGR